MDYHLIAQYNFNIAGDIQEKINIGEKIKEKRQCVFCSKGIDKTTFKKDAHIIPAALGNRSLFHYEECDNCNEHLFSRFENDLINYLQFDRILLRGKQRKGEPKYRYGKDKSYVKSDSRQNLVFFNLEEEEKTVEVIQKKDNEITIRFNKVPSYSLVGIYKAIFHMGWGLISDEERNEFKGIFEWLNDADVNSPLYMDSIFILEGGRNLVGIEVWKDEDILNNSFPYIFRLSYGHRIITIYVPLEFRNFQKPAWFDQFSFAAPTLNMQVTSYSVNDAESITVPYKEYTLKYNSMKTETSEN
ncbi:MULTISPECIES: HNH endonuclease [unclassified Exiguobacterium]|uniref:HNH endonuclease n=1 Tax=unclassified Exiguobacterium TaxID=2644629 RepID=UPI001BE7E691|nr:MULTISPECIES: HNH endonuclease [unclassified Exiguobacterium]